MYMVNMCKYLCEILCIITMHEVVCLTYLRHGIGRVFCGRFASHRPVANRFRKILHEFKQCFTCLQIIITFARYNMGVKKKRGRKQRERSVRFSRGKVIYYERL